MPERVTKEERMVTLAIEKARKTIETMRESTQVIPVDTEVEVQKIKRPKVQDASKITNQTQDKEGYGLAGETLKKSLVLKSREFAVGVDKRLNELKKYIRDNPEGYPPAMNPSDVKAVMKAIEDIEDIMGKFN